MFDYACKLMFNSPWVTLNKFIWYNPTFLIIVPTIIFCLPKKLLSMHKMMKNTIFMPIFIVLYAKPKNNYALCHGHNGLLPMYHPYTQCALHAKHNLLHGYQYTIWLLSDNTLLVSLKITR